MSRSRFASGVQFRWKTAPYQILRLLPAGQANLEDLLTGAVSIVEVATLVQALFAAELHFITSDQPVLTAPQAEARVLSLSDYPEPWQAIARYRLDIIRPLLDKAHRTRADVLARVQEIKQNGGVQERSLCNAVSVAALYRWIDTYTRSGNDLRALIPSVHQRGGKRASRLRPEVENLAQIVIQDKYQVQEKASLDETYCELVVRLAEENALRPPQDQLPRPSRATLARRITEAESGQAYRARDTRRRNGHVSRQVGQTPYPQLPLERVEIDHTRSDLIVIDERDNLPLGRLTLTHCLDTTTRYPLGYYLGFEPPSYLTVMECLHHAIRPKPNLRQVYGAEHDWLAYGLPTTLVIDNAKEFLGRDLEDACLLLGIVLQHTPVQTPQFKAGIERMFGSLNTMLFHTLPGTTFSNPAERGRYPSVELACVSLTEVDKMLHLFLVDIYAERFHRGLNAIPARCWEQKTQQGFAPALPPNAEELMILLGRTTTRVLHPYGIEFASLRYNCDELLPLRTRLKGQAAKLKYHPADLSALHVFDPFEQDYLRVPALDQEYTQGLSLWKHRIIRQAVLEEQDRVDLAALGKAKRKIQAIVEAGRQRKRQVRTRARLARWDTAGKPAHQAAASPEARGEAPAVSSSGVQAELQRSPFFSSETSLAEEADWEIGLVVPHPHRNPVRSAERQGQDE